MNHENARDAVKKPMIEGTHKTAPPMAEGTHQTAPAEDDKDTTTTAASGGMASRGSRKQSFSGGRQRRRSATGESMGEDAANAVGVAGLVGAENLDKPRLFTEDVEKMMKTEGICYLQF